jgi:hypothetical protein
MSRQTVQGPGVVVEPERDTRWIEMCWPTQQSGPFDSVSLQLYRVMERHTAQVHNHRCTWWRATLYFGCVMSEIQSVV